MKKLFVVVLIVILFNMIIQPAPSVFAHDQSKKNFAPPVLELPFPRGQTWYVCQGYFGTASGTHNNIYAFDLAVSKSDVGNTGCWGNQSGAAGRSVLAPANGTVTKLRSDLVSIQFNDGGCMILGHMDNIVTGSVKQGDQIGIVSKPSSLNGNFSHIHMEARTSCGGNSTPFSDKYRFNGVDNLPNKGGTNQYKGLALTRPSYALNLARGKTAYSTSVQSAGYESYKAFDASYYSRWSSRQSLSLGTEWLWVDLGTPQAINRVKIIWETAYAREFFVGYSDDCRTFSGWSYTKYSSATNEIKFSRVTKKCVGIKMKKPAFPYTNYSIFEVEVYND